MKKLKEKIEGAKTKVESTSKLSRFFGTFFKELKEGKNVFGAFKEALKKLVKSDLKTLKNKVEEKNEEKPKKSDSKKTDKKKETTGEKTQTHESEKAKAKKSEVKIPKVDINKFRKGKLFASISETFENTEVESKLVPLKTHVANARKGAPGWTKKSTDNWDHAAAGPQNTEKGTYSIEGTLAPSGYNRKTSGLNNVPSHIKPKLTKIAVALLKDPRMPLFKGIAMKVDGVEVMMVKEIHMHARGTGSTYLCQPHTGVSYIMKNS